MKRTLIYFMVLMLGLLVYQSPAYAVKLKIRGKGGVVVNPDGSQSLCPHFSLKVCYEIEGDIDDILRYIWDKIFNSAGPNPNGGGQNSWDINEYLPANVLVNIHQGNGIVTRQARIVWIDANYIPDSETGVIDLPSSAIKVKL